MSDIVVLLNCNEYRGDHSADVVIAYDLPDTMTLREVVDKLLPHPRAPYGSAGDCISIRRAEVSP